GLKTARRLGTAADAIADRRRLQPGKAVIIDIVDQQAAAGRTIAVKVDEQLALQLRKLGAVVVEHSQWRAVRRQQRVRRFVDGVAGKEIPVRAGLQPPLELRTRRCEIEAVWPAVMLAMLDRVDLLVRLEDIRQIPAVLSLQEGVVGLWKSGMQ